VSDILGAPPRQVPLPALPDLVGPLSPVSVTPLAVLTQGNILSTLTPPANILPVSVLTMSN
jgi:hypothetical protein